MYRTFVFICIICSIATASHSQELLAIEGIVLSEANIPLPSANLSLFNTQGNIVAYTTTNNQGNFSLTLDQKENVDSLQLKASFLGYYEQRRIFSLDQVTNNVISFEFLLKKKTESLTEVLLTAPPLPFFEKKKDTIVYNLKKSLTGQEQNLGEMLENLPGVRLNDRGKIEVNGKVIENLLINGESFFENQHQLATKNISPEMIEGISFFRKHRDFTIISDKENSLGTALNISIKSEFKNKLKGTINAALGVQDAYAIKAVSYNFSNTTNLTLITDWNSINEPSITPLDFYDLIGATSSFNNNLANNSLTREAQQSQLFEDLSEQVASRNLSFQALNFSLKITDKLRIKGYGILNGDKEGVVSQSNRIFESDTIPEQLEFLRARNRRSFGIFKIKTDWRIGDSSLLSYSVNYLPGMYLGNRKIKFGANDVDENRDVSNITFDQSLEFKTELKSLGLVKFNLFREYDKSDGHILLSYENQQPLISGIADTRLFQTTNFSRETLGFRTSFEKKVKKHTFVLFSSAQKQCMLFDSFNTDREVLNNTSKRELYSLSLSSSAKVVANNWLKLKGNLGIEFLDFDQSNDLVFNPSLGFTIKTSGLSSLDFNFQRSHSLIELNSTVNNSIIEDYRSIFQGSSLEKNNLFQKNSSTLSFSSVNPRSGSAFLAFLGYSNSKRSVQADIFTNSAGSNISKVFIGDTNKSLFGATSTDVKLSKNNLFAYVELDGVRSLLGNRQNGVNNILEFTRFKNLISIKTKSKRDLNLEIGNKIQVSSFRNSVSRSDGITTTTFDPFVKLKYKKGKRFYGELRTSYRSFISSFREQRNFFSISPLLNLSNQKGDWNFYLNGENVLNINKLEIIDNTSNSSFFEERIIRAFPGYLNLGVKYNF